MPAAPLPPLGINPEFQEVPGTPDEWETWRVTVSANNEVVVRRAPYYTRSSGHEPSPPPQFRPESHGGRIGQWVKMPKGAPCPATWGLPPEDYRPDGGRWLVFVPKPKISSDYLHSNEDKNLSAIIFIPMKIRIYHLQNRPLSSLARSPGVRVSPAAPNIASWKPERWSMPRLSFVTC